MFNALIWKNASKFDRYENFFTMFLKTICKYVFANLLKVRLNTIYFSFSNFILKIKLYCNS